MRLIEGNDITIGYEGDPVLSGLSFHVDEGDYLCIVGENGSGKSTFIKTVLSLIPPLAGRIVFGSGLKRNEIGYLPQQSGIQRDFPSSVMEVVLSGCLNRHRRLFGYSKEERERAVYELSRLGMEEKRLSSFQELSGGQQQRVLLARSLMATDRLLLLDEPSSGLDAAATAELYGIIDSLHASGAAIMMVTHDIHPALNSASTILHLSHGGYFFGTKDDYFRSEMGRIFLREAGHAHQ